MNTPAHLETASPVLVKDNHSLAGVVVKSKADEFGDKSNQQDLVTDWTNGVGQRHQKQSRPEQVGG